MLENYVKKQGLPDYRQVHHQMQSLGFWPPGPDTP
jgi:hypothetical protein